VKESPFKHRYRRNLRFWTVFFLLAVSTTISPALAENKPDNPDTTGRKNNEKIYITADKLISDNTAKYAEFIGNVRANQGESVITADRLKIFYKKHLADKSKPDIGRESIHQIVATGNVAIKFDNRVAESQQAVYNTETSVLVLTGADSKIISGNDTISGEKITFYRADGRIAVEGGHKERVEAVFFGGEKGLK
jgi:lipopolysaccharide export system protein LptA